MDFCVAITRGGNGRPWRFETPLAAHLHPLIQYGDAVLCGPDSVLSEYSIFELPRLLSVIQHSELSERVLTRTETLVASDTATRLVVDILKRENVHTDIWSALTRVVEVPPDKASEILELVRCDREWDLQHRRSGMAKDKAPAKEKVVKEKKDKLVGGHPLTAKLTFGSRKVEDKDVSWGTDEKNNPKRGGAATRFALYKKGMTIQAALDAGMSTGNVTHDLEKGYVVVQK